MEVGEVFMANHPSRWQCDRWQCDKSVGEGLSRVLADDPHPGMIAKFISSNSWLNTGTAATQRPNWLDNPKDDRDYEAIGCAVLFLNWLRFQLGHSWAEIVTAGGDLSAAYQKLTGKNTAWNDFSSFIDAQFPRGQQ